MNPLHCIFHLHCHDNKTIKDRPFTQKRNLQDVFVHKINKFLFWLISLMIKIKIAIINEAISSFYIKHYINFIILYFEILSSS